MNNTDPNQVYEFVELLQRGCYEHEPFDLLCPACGRQQQAANVIDEQSKRIQHLEMGLGQVLQAYSLKEVHTMDRTDWKQKWFGRRESHSNDDVKKMISKIRLRFKR